MKLSIGCLLSAVLINLLLVGCSDNTAQEAQGYIEGRYTYIATSVSGRLNKLLVNRGQRVKAGQLLFELEGQPETDAYQAALDNLKHMEFVRDAAAADLDFAKLMYERNKVLVPKRAIQQSVLDSSKAKYDAAIAVLAGANTDIATYTAKLAEAKWIKEQKTIGAPVDAFVFDTYYRIGEYTGANKPILSLLAPADIKAIFYIYQKDVGSIALQDKVSVRCDGCQESHEGRISFISPVAEYTPPVIFSNETSAKLIYRIEAAFAPETAMKLHPGQPVRVIYYPHG